MTTTYWLKVKEKTANGTVIAMRNSLKKSRGPLLGGLSQALSSPLPYCIVAVGLLTIGIYQWINQPINVYHGAWQQIRLHYYDQNRLGHWQELEHKYDDRIKTMEDAIKYTKLMLATLKDPYTRISSAKEVACIEQEHKGYYDRFGFSLRQDTQGKLKLVVVPDSPMAKSGLHSGDQVTKVNGSSVKGLSQAKALDLVPESSRNLEVEVLRAQKPALFKVTRARFFVPPVQTKLLPGKVGYIRIESFCDDSVPASVSSALQSQLKTARALVLDLRENRGGYIDNAVQLCSVFMKKGVVLKFLNDNKEYKCVLNPTESIVVSDREVDEVCKRSVCLTAGRPMVVLINGGSASAAEVVTAALRENQIATTLGETSYGKGIGQDEFDLPGNTRLVASTIQVKTPSGTWVGDGANKRTGLKPDITCKGSSTCILAGPGDVQLETARKLLLSRLRK